MAFHTANKHSIYSVVNKMDDHIALMTVINDFITVELQQSERPIMS